MTFFSLGFKTGGESGAMIEKRVKKLTLQESKNPAVDLYYWLSRTAEERIAAVELLRVQYH